VLQSCGVGQKQFIGLTLLMALPVVMVTGFVTLWLKPWSEVRVEKLYEDQRALTEFDTLAPGRFQTIRSGKRVTYTEDLHGDGSIVNPFINEFSDGDTNGPRDVKTLIARSGISRVDEKRNGRFLVLKNGRRYSGEPGKGDYQIVTYEEYGQLVEQEVSEKRARRRSAIKTMQLLEDDGLRSQGELHWRIGIVLLIPVITLMAIPLSKVNPRQGRFTRLIPALVLCFFYILLLSVARSSLERGDTPTALGLWWVHGLFILITLMLYQYDRLVALLSAGRARKARAS
ncbi:MAG: LPS export ABC transporter permease LptF, partial [Gammaproteobacteria bacterium]|nr:LPS export ABC transporter permease LptF [Gammaproteobacteria bacterium]